MGGIAQANCAKREACGHPRDPTSAAGIGQFSAIQSAAQSLGVNLTPVSVRDAGEIERGVAAFARSDTAA